MTDNENASKTDTPAASLQRRGSIAAMMGGLLAGYGTLAAFAVRYLYPARPPERRWMYVTRLAAIGLDETLVYRTPTGETVNITRKGSSGHASDFVALSSVCPHLGCQVHWEPQNDRYFCPCHNGVFDPDGVGISGPPGDAGQSLSRYELQAQDGILYIRVTTESLTSGEAVADAGGLVDIPRTRSGHDPCLTQLPSIRAAQGRGSPSKGPGAGRA